MYILYQTTVLKQPPFSVDERLCNSSSNETVFESTKLEYREAVIRNGYKSTLKYKLKNTPGRNRNRCRNITWFNPLFSKNITTNVAKIFFHLLDKHCPKSNNLYKIFNRNIVKVSYSRIGNMSQIIKRHNKRLTKANRRPLAP